MNGSSAGDASRPARRPHPWPADLFETGKVASVHIYGNMVTVDIEKGHDSHRAWPTSCGRCIGTGSRV